MAREYIRPRQVTKKRRKYQENISYEISKTKWIVSIKKLISRKNYSKALSEIEAYLEKYPNDSYGLFQLGCIYDEMGEKELAKEQFRYIIDNNLESIHSSMFKLATMACKEADYETAQKLLIENIETSNYPEIYSIIKLTDIYLQRGEKEKALAVLFKYGDMSNEDIIIQYAIILNATQERDFAYDVLLSHTYSKECYSKYYSTKASIEANIDLPEEALKTLEEGSIYFDNPDRTDYIKAVALYRLNRYEESIDTIRQIISRENPEFVDKAYYMLGEIYSSQQKYDEAIKSHLMTVECQMVPIYKGYYNAAEIYALVGDFDKAKEYYHKCIDNSINKQLISSSYLRICFLEYREYNIENIRNYISRVNVDLLEPSDVSNYAFLKAYLNHEDGIIYKCPTYSYKQTYDYSLERLVEHIDKDHGHFGKMARFNSNIDLNELVLSIPELLEKSVLVKNNDFDYYMVEYENIGYIGEKSTDYMEMIVIPNTKKVLTMYPVNPRIDCKKEQKEDKKIENKRTKQKHMSRIEKFNQKYGIKGEK